MAANALVQTRIDADIKDRATAVDRAREVLRGLAGDEERSLEGSRDRSCHTRALLLLRGHWSHV